MSGEALLLLGLGLGLRHATDADHLVVISSLLQRGSSLRCAVRVAVLWGLGHSAAFIGVGLLIVLAELRPPATFGALAELLVGGMLVVLGAAQLARSWACSGVAASPGPTRPLVVGVVHGLGGSAAVALLVATSSASPGWAVAYLLLFGLGTVLGMVALTVLLAWSFARALRGRAQLARRLTVASALLGVALGVYLSITALADLA